MIGCPRTPHPILMKRIIFILMWPIIFTLVGSTLIGVPIAMGISWLDNPSGSPPLVKNGVTILVIDGVALLSAVVALILGWRGKLPGTQRNDDKDGQ